MVGGGTAPPPDAGMLPSAEGPAPSPEAPARRRRPPAHQADAVEPERSDVRSSRTASARVVLGPDSHHLPQAARSLADRLAVTRVRRGSGSSTNEAGHGQSRRDAPGRRPPSRLGRGHHGIRRPRGRGPPEDRADRTRDAGSTDPSRGEASRRRRRRGAGGDGAIVGRPGHVSCAGRAGEVTAPAHRLDVAPSLAARLPRRHSRPASCSVRGPGRLRHVPPGAGRARPGTGLGGQPLRRQGGGAPSSQHPR